MIEIASYFGVTLGRTRESGDVVPDYFQALLASAANDNSAPVGAFMRVRCEVCGGEFLHRYSGIGRLRRFCSTECRHSRELAWKAKWRRADREARRGPLLPGLDLPPGGENGSTAEPFPGDAPPSVPGRNTLHPSVEGLK